MNKSNETELIWLLGERKIIYSHEDPHALIMSMSVACIWVFDKLGTQWRTLTGGNAKILLRIDDWLEYGKSEKQM